MKATFFPFKQDKQVATGEMRNKSHLLIHRTHTRGKEKDVSHETGDIYTNGIFNRMNKEQ